MAKKEAGPGLQDPTLKGLPSKGRPEELPRLPALIDYCLARPVRQLPLGKLKRPLRAFDGQAIHLRLTGLGESIGQFMCIVNSGWPERPSKLNHLPDTREMVAISADHFAQTRNRVHPQSESILAQRRKGAEKTGSTEIHSATDNTDITDEFPVLSVSSALSAVQSLLCASAPLREILLPIGRMFAA